MADIKPSKRPRPKRNLTPEGRARLSQIAKERHAKGEFGGSEFGKLGGRGNTKEKRRAAQSIAEALRDPDNTQSVIQVLKDAIHSDTAMGQRLKALELWVSIEREESKLTLQEDRAASDQLTREEMIGSLRRALMHGPVAHVLRNATQIEEETGIVDADVVEEEDDDAQAA